MKTSNYRKLSQDIRPPLGHKKCRHSNVLTTLSLGLNKEAVIISQLVVGQGQFPAGFQRVPLRDHNDGFKLSANLYGGDKG